MNKGFPNKILGIFPYGWKDKGCVGSSYNPQEESNSYTCCGKCRTKARVGIDEKGPFLYCKKCECKLV